MAEGSGLDAGSDRFWNASMTEAPTALPEALVDGALATTWPLPDARTQSGRAWHRRIETMTDRLRLRRRILTEIPGDDESISS